MGIQLNPSTPVAGQPKFDANQLGERISTEVANSALLYPSWLHITILYQQFQWVQSQNSAAPCTRRAVADVVG